jgi:dipeptidyl aminopeptidase/acylaminoacyl peptidase
MNNTSVDLIPRAVLFGNPERTMPQLSPDGAQLAFLAPLDDVMNVWVGPIGGEYRAITRSKRRGIPGFRWQANGSHILYVQDADGDENYHLFAVEVSSGESRDLTPFENVAVRMGGASKQHPDTVVVQINRDNPALHDAYRIDVTSGEITMVAKNPGAAVGFLVDRDLRVRAALQVRPDGGNDLLVRESEEAEWRTLLTWSADDALGSAPVDFSRDGADVLLLDSRDANARRLVRVNIATGERTVLAEDPTYDVSDIVLHPDTYEVQLVAFHRARTEWTVLDDAIRDDVEALRALHHGDFDISSRDDADRLWLVTFSADDGPLTFWLYDRDTRSGRLLMESRPELSRYRFGAMEPFEITTRDGLPLRGYITFPPDLERRNLPLVLVVHGGPWTRDVWRFHPEAQWLANRGYICLQVNYRGSTGYGKAFLNAGDREWGGRMHDDLVDAVRWTIEQGYADENRLAIYGGSYGGYAALVGATFTPDLFRCAVAIVGPSNLITFIRTIPPYWTPMIETFNRRVGNPETEPEFLMSRSPIARVDEIRIPMLIAHGANDPRVKQSESEQIVETMRAKGIRHQYLLFPDEGHGFARPENRMKFYATAERFLAEHLGGRYENGADDEAQEG